MSLLHAMCSATGFILEGMTGVIGLYQVIISMYGFLPRQPHRTYQPTKRIVAIIPAHNEAHVIGNLIDSLKAQRYPRALYDIVVIADHCTDGTARVARRRGASVYVREGEQERGKGHAIAWLLRAFSEERVDYDAISIFDADNLVHPDFLMEMNHQLSAGHRVIQGYLGVKNPFDTWVTVSLAISYWFSNRMWQYARRRLGLACALGGTGLCIDYTVIREVGWHATGLTEDVEFGVRCVLAGIIPVWAHDAKVFDEKPLDIKTSARQRIRWMQGHFLCAREHMFLLCKQGLLERNLLKLDAGLYLFQPMRFLFLFISSITVGIQAFTHSHVSPGIHLIPTYMWGIINGFLFLQVPFALLLERVNWRAYAGLTLLPFFLWTWGPVTLYAFFTKTNRRWVHTHHRRALQFDDLRSR